MKIFAGHDGGTGCAYYRMTLPLGELARHDGFDVTFADSGDAAGVAGRAPVTLRHLQGYDVIVAQRWNKHEGLEVLRRARTPFSRLVYELDDDVFSITSENWNAYNLYGRGDIRDATEHAAQISDLVTVTTEPLAQVMRQFSGNVVICPNCIPGWVLDLPRKSRERPRVGWQGGASHGVDIGLAASPVRRFLRRFPGWDLQLNGTDYRPTFKVPADRAFYTDWIRINDDPHGYYASIDFDIGIAPVYPTTFSNSKSAIKVIEYGARGIVSVASDVPAYRDVITHGVDGFLVRRDHEWLRYLSELASDTALRERMSAAARAMAARYLIEDGWKAWASAYQRMFR